MGIKYQVQLEEEANETYDLFPVVLYATIFPIFIGLFLRLPKLILEIKHKKKWTFDWIKFSAIALPCLYIITITILAYSPLGGGFIKVPKIILIGSPTIQMIVGIVFGYALLDSLKK